MSYLVGSKQMRHVGPWIALALFGTACGGRTETQRGDGGRNAEADDDSGTGATGGGGLVKQPGTGGDNSTGGVEAAGGAGDNGAGGSPPGDGGAVSGGSGGNGAGGSAEEEPFESAISEPLWTTPFDVYGLGASRIWFVPGEDLVEVTAGESRNATVRIDRLTGEIQEESVEAVGLWGAVSDDGRVRAGRGSEPCVLYVDSVEQFSLPSNCYVDEVALAADGTAVSIRGCTQREDERVLELTTIDTASGEVVAQIVTDLSCVQGWNPPTIVDPAGQRTIFGHVDFADVFVFDWESRMIERAPVHQAVVEDDGGPMSTVGGVIELSLSPDGGSLVSVGARDGLAVLDSDTLGERARLADVAFFNFSNCFCTYASESPVAWTRDGKYLTTTDPSGGIVIREAETLEPVVTLTPPDDPPSEHFDDFGPLMVEFSPDDTQLVAFYPDQVVGYSLAPR